MTRKKKIFPTREAYQAWFDAREARIHRLKHHTTVALHEHARERRAWRGTTPRGGNEQSYSVSCDRNG